MKADQHIYEFMYDLVWESEESAGTAEGGVGMYETYE